MSMYWEYNGGVVRKLAPATDWIVTSVRNLLVFFITFSVQPLLRFRSVGLHYDNKLSYCNMLLWLQSANVA